LFVGASLPLPAAHLSPSRVPHDFESGSSTFLPPEELGGWLWSVSNPCFFGLQRPWPLWYRQASCTSAHPPCGGVLFRPSGRGGCSQPSLSSSRSPGRFQEPRSYCYTGNRSVASLRYARYPWVCGFPEPLAVLVSARSLAPRHVLLAKASFLSTQVRRLFATVSFFLTDSRVFSRAAIYIFPFRMARRLAQVCKLPLKLWRFSASGRVFAARSLVLGTPFLQRGPFVSLRCGGCSQPSHSPSRAPERFRESASFVYTRTRRVA
jgi:hypothetical protein